MSNIHTLTSTQQQTTVNKPNKRGSKKGIGNSNIHTLETVAQDDNERTPAIEEALIKAYEVLNMFQGDIHELKTENVGLKCVIEEYGIREKNRDQTIETLQRRLELNDLAHEKVSKVGKSVTDNVETFIRNMGKQISDEEHRTIKDRYLKKYFNN